MESTSLYKALLKFDTNVILNVKWDCIDKILNNEQLIEGDDIFEIQQPCSEPKPENLLSAWPPQDRCYFYHNYYHGSSKKFFDVGDHIANFKPEHKEAVVALNRLNLMEFSSTKHEEKWYFAKLMASLKPKTKLTIFNNIDFSSIHNEYMNYLKLKNYNAVKVIKKKIKYREKRRKDVIQKFIKNYDLKTDYLKTQLILKK